MKTRYLLGGALALLLGCTSDDEKSAPRGAGTKTATAEAKAPKAAETPAPEEPATFTWTDSPELAHIPDHPIRGSADGEPFEARTVLIEPGYKSWKISIHDRALNAPTGLLMGSQHVDVNLEEAPAAGKTLKREMSYGGGYWQIARPDDPKKTTSWNASNAYVIEFTKWDVKPWDPDGDTFQEAGRASGKLAVVYKGGGDFENSWVAGTFEDAVVRYMGTPFWEEEKAE